MKDEVYIVINKEQEQKAISKIKQSGGKGIDSFVSHLHVDFPYVIHDQGKFFGYDRTDAIENHRRPWNVVFDGRKENKMDKKIKIDEKTYKSLVEWKDSCKLKFITSIDMFQLPRAVDDWLEDVNTLFENRNRFIAIIEWLSGKDVFEIEKPKKWVVQSKDRDSDIYKFAYVIVKQSGTMVTTYRLENATKFDTKEEAESWTNSHQKVIEVEE